LLLVWGSPRNIVDWGLGMTEAVQQLVHGGAKMGKKRFVVVVVGNDGTTEANAIIILNMMMMLLMMIFTHRH
jgi:hypothetical protein